MEAWIWIAAIGAAWASGAFAVWCFLRGADDDDGFPPMGIGA